MPARIDRAIGEAGAGGEAGARDSRGARIRARRDEHRAERGDRDARRRRDGPEQIRGARRGVAETSRATDAIPPSRRTIAGVCSQAAASGANTLPRRAHTAAADAAGKQGGGEPAARGAAGVGPSTVPGSASILANRDVFDEEKVRRRPSQLIRHFPRPARRAARRTAR